MTDDERNERERLRQECRDDLDVLRLDPDMPERVFRLYEKILARLDRLETGTFDSTEKPTDPRRDGTARADVEPLQHAVVEAKPTGRQRIESATEVKRQRHDSTKGWKNDPVFEALGVPKKPKKDGSGEDDA